jgi:DNA-binding NtrC family response regulator
MAQILVIDDDAAVCSTVQQILQRHGYTVSTVSRASEAFILAERHNFDLIVCDLVMPDMDGVAAIRVFKDRYPHLPVIAMSGGARLGTFDTLASARDAGADELLRKPFNVASLVAAVKMGLSHDKSETKINPPPPE